MTEVIRIAFIPELGPFLAAIFWSVLVAAILLTLGAIITDLRSGLTTAVGSRLWLTRLWFFLLFFTLVNFLYRAFSLGIDSAAAGGAAACLLIAAAAYASVNAFAIIAKRFGLLTSWLLTPLAKLWSAVSQKSPVLIAVTILTATGAIYAVQVVFTHDPGRRLIDVADARKLRVTSETLFSGRSRFFVDNPARIRLRRPNDVRPSTIEQALGSLAEDTSVLLDLQTEAHDGFDTSIERREKAFAEGAKKMTIIDYQSQRRSYPAQHRPSGRDYDYPYTSLHYVNKNCASENHIDEIIIYAWLAAFMAKNDMENLSLRELVARYKASQGDQRVEAIEALAPYLERVLTLADTSQITDYIRKYAELPYLFDPSIEFLTCTSSAKRPTTQSSDSASSTVLRFEFGDEQFDVFDRDGEYLNYSQNRDWLKSTRSWVDSWYSGKGGLLRIDLQARSDTKLKKGARWRQKRSLFFGERRVFGLQKTVFFQPEQEQQGEFRGEFEVVEVSRKDGIVEIRFETIEQLQFETSSKDAHKAIFGGPFGQAMLQAMSKEPTSEFLHSMATYTVGDSSYPIFGLVSVSGNGTITVEKTKDRTSARWNFSGKCAAFRKHVASAVVHEGDCNYQSVAKYEY